MRRLSGALVGGLMLAAIAQPAAACRVPFFFDPARETHDAVVVATTVSRIDRAPIMVGPRSDRRPMEAGWVAELQTVSVIKGSAPQTIRIANGPVSEDDEIVIMGGCYNGIETPNPGQTYVVYLDRVGEDLKPVRLLNLNAALEQDPIFGHRER